MRNILIRTAIWTSAGFLVSLGWGFYFAFTNKGIPIGPAVHALARLTQPTAAVILYLHPASALGLTWVAVANAVTYALLGLVVETIRPHFWSLHLSD